MRAPIGAETIDYVELKFFLLTYDPEANYQHQHISLLFEVVQNIFEIINVK